LRSNFQTRKTLTSTSVLLTLLLNKTGTIVHMREKPVNQKKEGVICEA